MLKPKEWSKLKLHEFANIIKDVYIPSGNDNLPYIGLEHINQQTLTLNSIGKSSDIKSAKFKFKAGDILFGKLRPYFRKVYHPNFSGICSTDIWVIRAKDGFDQGWLFWLLASQDFIDSASQGSSGTRMPRADWNHLKNTAWPVPTPQKQQQIAEILSSLDDKIELNRRINDNLEAVASALFKRWFIDFEFPDKNGQPYKNNNGKMLTSELGPIPDGWSINQAQELFDFTKGIEPGNKNYTPIESEITIPFFRVADLFNGNQSKTYIDESIAGTAIMNNNDVLIATDGTVGRVATGLYGSYSGGIKKVISKDKSISNSFIYFWLKSSIVQDKLKEYASNATTIAHASGAIKDLKIAYNKEIIKKFCVLSQPILEEITNNLSENIKIKKVIDLLLPRMLSGKIKV